MKRGSDLIWIRKVTCELTAEIVRALALMAGEEKAPLRLRLCLHSAHGGCQHRARHRSRCELNKKVGTCCFQPFWKGYLPRRPSVKPTSQVMGPALSQQEVRMKEERASH